MSVLIKNMDMPKTCSECPIRKVCHYTPFKVTEAFKAELFMKRPEFCSLIEIPENHGRLIDETEMLDFLVNYGQHDSKFKLGEIIKYSPSEIQNIIKNLKAVIEAE